MQNCEQTSGQSIYDHGLSVWKHLDQLLTGDTEKFRLPQWYTLYKDQLKSTCYNSHILRLYATYHDCGKPYCLTVDENGKRHFPNHTELSKQVWSDIFGSTPPNDTIGQLIGLDMIMHSETFDQIIARNLSNQVISSLLLSALAELHSNARLFGGSDTEPLNSTSFKIKWKRLNSLGNKLVKEMWSEVHDRQ